jgi:hypothetical protein
VHFFARPEDWHLFLSHPDSSPTFWISANAACSILDGKRAKAAQLDAILPSHRSNDFIEYNVYGFFHHTLGEMKELTCYVDERQLRFDHYNGASVVVKRTSVRSIALRSFVRNRVQFTELRG